MRIKLPHWLMVDRGLTTEEIEATVRLPLTSAVLVYVDRREIMLPLSKIEITVTAEAPERAQAPSAPVRRATECPNWCEVRKGRLYLFTADYDESLAGLPGRRWDKEVRANTYPISPAVAYQIAQHMQGKPFAPGPLAALVVQYMGQIAAQAHKTNDNLDPIPNSRYPGWNHQRQAYWFAEQMQAVGLFLEMGCGKSKIAVDLFTNRSASLSLILAPNAVVETVWESEFAKHAGRESLVQALYGKSIVKRVAIAKQAIEAGRRLNKPVVLVLNYESAWREPMAGFLLSLKLDEIALDESHRIKAPGGKAALFCGRLGDKSRASGGRRALLTGTPMPHSPLDVYAQYRFLDPGIFGSSYAAFKMRYAVMGGFQGKQVVAYRVIETVNGRPNPYYDKALADEFNEKLYSIAFRVKSADVLDLPELIVNERKCTLSPKARRAYDDLEEKLKAEFEQGETTVSNALTKLLRLQQITSGHLPTDDGETVHIDDSKEKLLADVMEDIVPGEPIVVFGRFSHDLDAIKRVAEKQGRTCAELSGRERTLAAWQRGEYDVIAVQIQSGGTGIDLTRARYGIYYSVGFNLGDYMQSVAREHRPGQTRTVYYYHLVSEGTVDEKVYGALASRRDLVEAVLIDGRAS